MDKMDEGYTTTADCRGEWVHVGTPKSYKFTCSQCGGMVYYPQRGGKRIAPDVKPVPKIMYPYCPYCLRHMNIQYGLKVKKT